MRRRSVLLAISVLSAGLLVASLAGATAGKKNFKADLDGHNEVPAVSSNGSGTASGDDRRRRPDHHLRALVRWPQLGGALRPTDVIGPAGQGIAAGEFDELVRAVRARVTYANVHTSAQPGGEIRDQLH